MTSIVCKRDRRVWQIVESELASSPEFISVKTRVESCSAYETFLSDGEENSPSICRGKIETCELRSSYESTTSHARDRETIRSHNLARSCVSSRTERWKSAFRSFPRQRIGNDLIASLFFFNFFQGTSLPRFYAKAVTMIFTVWLSFSCLATQQRVGESIAKYYVTSRATRLNDALIYLYLS